MGLPRTACKAEQQNHSSVGLHEKSKKRDSNTAKDNLETAFFALLMSGAQTHRSMRRALCAQREPENHDSVRIHEESMKWAYHTAKAAIEPRLCATPINCSSRGIS